MMQNEDFILIPDEKDPNTYYMPLAKKLREYMLLENNDTLFTYVDSIHQQIFFTPFKLSDALLRIEFNVEDFPGVLANITGILKDKKINIEKYCDIGAGGLGIIEMIVTHPEISTPINVAELQLELNNIQHVKYATIEFVFPTIPSSIKSNFFGMSRLTNKGICIRNIFGKKGIDLKLEENQLGLISCYSKIHLIIANFYPKKDFIEFYYEHIDHPGAIARASCVLKDYITIKGTNHGTSSEQNGRWRGYGLLIKEVELEEIKNRLKKIEEDFDPEKHVLMLNYVSDKYVL